MVLFKDSLVKEVVVSWSKGITQTVFVLAFAFSLAFFLVCALVPMNPTLLFFFDIISIALWAMTVLGLSDVVIPFPENKAIF